LIPGYDIPDKDGWQNFVFRIKNNLTRNEYMGYNSKFREFKMQVVYFVTLYEKIEQQYTVYGKSVLIQPRNPRM